MQNEFTQHSFYWKCLIFELNLKVNRIYLEVYTRSQKVTV